MMRRSPAATQKNVELKTIIPPRKSFFYSRIGVKVKPKIACLAYLRGDHETSPAFEPRGSFSICRFLIGPLVPGRRRRLQFIDKIRFDGRFGRRNQRRDD